MNPEIVMDIGRHALWVTVLLAAPLLLSALAVGLIIGLFQAATQIQEQTLSFIPKLISLVVALLVGGNWMINTLIDFTTRLFLDIPGLIG